MKYLYRIGVHQFGRNGSCTGVSDDIFELRNAGPVAVVIEKPAAFTFFEVFSCVRTGFRHIALYPRSDCFNMIAE